MNGPRAVHPGPGPEIILNDWTFNAGLDADRDLQVESTSGKINGAFGVRPGRTLRLVGGGTWAYTTLTVAGGFENQGTIELTSDSTTYYAWLKMSGKTLTNAVGGVLRVAEGSNVLHYIDANLDNPGTFEVARNVNLTGSSHKNSGETRVLTGAALNVQGGSLTNTSAGLLSGTGTFGLAGTTVFNEGTVHQVHRRARWP